LLTIRPHLPLMSVRAAQLYLTYLGFHPGPIDRVAATRSQSALADFQTQHGLAKTSTIDSRMVAQSAALPGSIPDTSGLNFVTRRRLRIR
jgi:peptidoglycan hydrolase-like protein with peptidoglycan-binding domain